jgi:hypothetical protein
MIFCGELSLDGRVKPVAGCLPMAIQARDSGYSDIILVIALYTTPGSVKYPLVATPFGIYFAERGRRPARDIHVNSVGRQRGDFRPQTPGRPPYSRKSENRRRKTDVPYSVLVTPEVSSPGPQSSVFRASGKSLI